MFSLNILYFRKYEILSLPGKALRMLVDTARLAKIKRILGVCLLISSLTGKTLRMLVDIARLAEI